MTSRRSSRICLSIGGSIIVPDQVDGAFVRRLRGVFLSLAAAKTQAVVTIGGGALARQWQAAARSAGVAEPAALDALGMAAVRINSRYVANVFGQLADPVLYPVTELPSTPRAPVTFVLPVFPGRTTDHVAVAAARHFRIRTIYNLTNVKQVYTKDPRKFRYAKPLTTLSWREYWKLIPRRATPGLKSPFDPVASRLAAKHGLNVVILDGRTLNNLRRALNNYSFVGTTIRP